MKRIVMWMASATGEEGQAKNISATASLGWVQYDQWREDVIRVRGQRNFLREKIPAASGITGWPLWLVGQVLVKLRDFYLYSVRRRTRHPKNIYN